ncbi:MULTISPECIES: phosphoribosyltransferase [unclassified Pseudofrankia]|uniref:phosphoribosyltransferase n=1 Tax=unclassified Pseudofrankia TaxID=2994372 RepID=UPI0008D994F2|nr:MULTISPECIES: phosphoribosyltransferase family protein [unclassified Pseudofrankia]MDT3439656.1 phosphoribosyltransferase family protein [Pseudofrankia sp. BMG5.37]OHV42820.1 phosphoribosyltransferase [Pseudofrankia sp. BMG5.36]
MTGYADRRAAGRALAGRVVPAVPEGEPVIVLGLPRGGVPVAAEVARRLSAPLEAFGVRKLGAPGQPEFALGAIATGGIRVVNEAVVGRLGLTDAELETLVAREMAELARREHTYRDGRPAPALAGRTVVLVDDGLATGATMVAAARAARAAGAARLVAAVPVASPEGADAVLAEVDELVCPLYPPDFMAVGQFYDDFAATSDEEVRDLLGVLLPHRSAR